MESSFTLQHRLWPARAGGANPRRTLGDHRYAGGLENPLQKHHVPQYEVRAFGARAKRKAKPYSDLDLAVITERPLAVSAALAEDFSEFDLPWKADVVDLATTSEAFRKVIKRGEVVMQKGNRGKEIA